MDSGANAVIARVILKMQQKIMRSFLRKSKALAKRKMGSSRFALDQRLGALRNSPLCLACGLRGELVQQKALWPELIEQWGLSPQWAAWFDQREGHLCPHCGSSLRAQQLAEVIIETINSNVGTRAINLAQLCILQRPQELHVAEINSAGTLHQFLDKLPHLCYSEFGSSNPQVPSEDLANLSYEDSTFDYVITSETLEHVPDVDLALREIHRVLKPNGKHIFTVPMVEEQPQTRQRASIQEGQLVCYLPKSYHGSPAEGKDDYLVFSEFGSDFIERVEKAQFDLKLIRDEHNPALIVFVASRN